MAAEVVLGREYLAHYKVMMEKLNEQRQLDRFTDITLIVDGHHFRAHKAVLAACSQFFYNFFQEFTQEPMVEIEGVSNMAFRQLLEFTYTATLAVVEKEEALDVWKAAEYLQMQEAIKALDDKMNGKQPAVTQSKKRKIAETSNVITETLPSVEAEQVEIQVVEENAIEVAPELVEVVDMARSNQSDDSALALLADITSKYEQGEPSLQEVVYQEETETTPKAMDDMDFMDVQMSQVNGLFPCEKCGRTFQIYQQLKQHMKTHTGLLEKRYVCKHCGKTYLREGAYKQHINTFHYDMELLSHKPQKKVHVCEYCKKCFDHFGHFKEHLRKHTGEKPFECPDCRERFARNSTLKCHMAACQNGAGAKKGRKKLYECQVCNSVFNIWDQFKDHLVSHTGVKPNHCTMCDMWFTNAKELKSHLKDVHSIEDSKSTDELVIDSPASIAVQNLAAAETVLVEEGIHVEHVTVEPVDLIEMGATTTVVLDEGAVAGMCEEDVERLKQAGLQIQVVHVTTGEVEGQQVLNSQVEVEEDVATAMDDIETVVV
ncbi:zinc finger protein 131 isoform X1 [Synchiropus splendidus]|uniref:zinc finger protein 131 isoform X1 n=2 Tax=Synchiropus splendidus TaxID=270530 RepID=UPI00237E4CE9|nr:zinc finger protein 131 isoform X1 [Synchiropus splendidus]XP_053727315.1 zinc finger protein 131 isoform X1 [Synchiropus splendidus]